MMKKLFSLSAVAASFMLSSHAFAAAATLTQSTMITPTHCPALANNITVQLSKDVQAGFNCGTSSFAAATCHVTGTNKPQLVPAQYDTTKTPAVLLPGYTNCTKDAVTNAETCSFNGRIGFRGTSQGGQVGAAPLGALPCTAANAATLVPDTMLFGDTSATTQP